jgi:hypothetical protein
MELLCIRATWILEEKKRIVAIYDNIVLRLHIVASFVLFVEVFS